MIEVDVLLCIQMSTVVAYHLFVVRKFHDDFYLDVP